MTLGNLIMLAVGFCCLFVGAELLVRGAVRLSTTLQISPLIIGLTVVAFGTSSPEMAVSVQSAVMGEEDISVGNVVGSNIFNILFILGLSSVILPLKISKEILRSDVPIMLGVSIITYIFCMDGKLSRFEGLILFVGMIAYTIFLIKYGKSVNPNVSDTDLRRSKGPIKHLALGALGSLVGLGLLIMGSRWLVKAAVAMAVSLGIREVVIGLTLVAAGTSLPEVATTVMAALKRQRDIAVGNVIGSNIFNLMAVLGPSAFLSKGGIGIQQTLLRFDFPIMLAASFACLPIFFTGYIIARWEGLLFLGYYVAYTVYLILHATESPALSPFSSIMLSYVVPITVITIIIIFVNHIKSSR